MFIFSEDQNNKKKSNILTFSNKKKKTNSDIGGGQLGDVTGTIPSEIGNMHLTIL